MRIRSLIVLLIVLLFAATSTTMGKNDSAAISEFTATVTFDPFGVLGNGPVGYFIDFGTRNCPGHEVPANPFAPCPAGSRIHRFGVKWVALLNSQDARFNGPMTLDVKLLWDEDSTGQTWARYRIDVNGGGEWNGICTGSRRRVDDHHVEVLNCSGRGTGGIVEGQHVDFTNTIVQYPSPVIFYVGNIEGRVLDPQSN
ncbi:MAG: hypothetical protein WBD16_08710 [Pyrinomonadaceae bacterium]